MDRLLWARIAGIATAISGLVITIRLSRGKDPLKMAQQVFEISEGK